MDLPDRIFPIQKRRTSEFSGFPLESRRKIRIFILLSRGHYQGPSQLEQTQPDRIASLRGRSGKHSNGRILFYGQTRFLRVDTVREALQAVLFSGKETGLQKVFYPAVHSSSIWSEDSRTTRSLPEILCRGSNTHNTAGASRWPLATDGLSPLFSIFSNPRQVHYSAGSFDG